MSRNLVKTRNTNRAYSNTTQQTRSWKQIKTTAAVLFQLFVLPSSPSYLPPFAPRFVLSASGVSVGGSSRRNYFMVEYCYRYSQTLAEAHDTKGLRSPTQWNKDHNECARAESENASRTNAHPCVRATQPTYPERTLTCRSGMVKRYYFDLEQYSELDRRVYLCVVVNVKKVLDSKRQRDTEYSLLCFKAKKLVLGLYGQSRHRQTSLGRHHGRRRLHARQEMRLFLVDQSVVHEEKLECARTAKHQRRRQRQRGERKENWKGYLRRV